MSVSSLRIDIVTAPAGAWMSPTEKSFFLQLADGRDHRGGAAGEGFGDLARRHAVLPFVDGHLAFLDPHAAIARQLQDAGTGDAVEDAAGQGRGDDAAIAVNEEHVHATEFFQVPALDRIEEQHLRATVLAGFQLRQQRAA